MSSQIVKPSLRPLPEGEGQTPSFAGKTLFFAISRLARFKCRAQLFLLSLNRFFAFVDKTCEVVADLPAAFLEHLPSFVHFRRQLVSAVVGGARRQLTSLTARLRRN